jgi:hypothetical protein
MTDDKKAKSQPATCRMPPPTELPQDLSEAEIQGMVEGLFIQEDRTVWKNSSIRSTCAPSKVNQMTPFAS